MPTLKEIENNLKHVLSPNADNETETEAFADRVVGAFVSYLTKDGGSAIEFKEEQAARAKALQVLRDRGTYVLAVSARFVAVTIGEHKFSLPIRVAKMEPRLDENAERYWLVWFGDDKMIGFAKEVSDQLLQSVATTMSATLESIIRDTVAHGGK